MSVKTNPTHLALVVAAALVAHAITLGHAFVWDDFILLDQKVRFYRGPLDVWLEPTELPGFRVYRPLTFGSYWLDQLVWTRNPLGFHLTSLGLHGFHMTDGEFPGEFHFSCRLTEEGTRVTRRFEAEADSAVAAATDVLGQVEQWMASR